MHFYLIFSLKLNLHSIKTKSIFSFVFIIVESVDTPKFLFLECSYFPFMQGCSCIISTIPKDAKVIGSMINASHVTLAHANLLTMISVKQKHMNEDSPYNCRKSSPAGSSARTESLRRFASCVFPVTIFLREMRAQLVGRLP